MMVEPPGCSECILCHAAPTGHPAHSCSLCDHTDPGQLRTVPPPPKLLMPRLAWPWGSRELGDVDGGCLVPQSLSVWCLVPSG